jgi:primosomal protein N' (replication factor Y)
MKYAEVAVDAPVGSSHSFSYSIPENFTVEPGQLVWVPFGRRVAQGIVLELSATPQVELTRDILQQVEPSPLVSPLGLKLAQWISQYYLCSLFDALALMLPPRFKAHVRSKIAAAKVSDDVSDSLSLATREALQTLGKKKHLDEADFTKLLGPTGTREVNRLVDRGLIQRQVDLPHPGRFHYDCFLIPTQSNAGDANSSVPRTSGSGGLIEGLPLKQAQLLNTVAMASENMGNGYPVTLANKVFGSGTANALMDKGLLAMEWIRADAESPSPKGNQGVKPQLTLTGPQSDALECITASLNQPRIPSRSFLLHGVTGSGKTEVYLRAMEQVVERGQQSIFLVPEISLTPQTVERVSGRFPGRVAVIHSRQKTREKFDQWWKIRDGGYDVVVGPRSALFAPLPNLGLIVIDEEHEWTYKQEEGQPLYHARTTALELARLTKAVVIMGSATPDVETYYQAQSGRHRLLELPHRVRPNNVFETAQLAETEVCDMREELREGNRSIFSRRLEQDLIKCIRQGQQAILFLNRRGSSPIVQCRDCGYVVTCASCSVSLTFHSAESTTDTRLLCHQCNRSSRIPRLCRLCGGTRIRQLGIGTQKVVDEVTQLLPGVTIERWDADAFRGGSCPEETMRRLASGEIQVLVGTQMVAKGLDVPNVTLVGVILADVGLHLPDFRAGERAFGLICQVAGRSGRGLVPGRVIIQTYNPDHYAVAAASQQNYSELYQQEIESRQQQGNPPFNRLVHLVYHNINAAACQRQATETARLFRLKVGTHGLSDVEVIGPAPGIPQRVRGHYRWHVTLRGRNLHRFLEGIKFASNWTVDVDPAHVL